LTYGGLSNSEGGEKRKDHDGLHDGNGERKERGSGGGGGGGGWVIVVLS
jgi:hypothetical protein